MSAASGLILLTVFVSACASSPSAGPPPLRVDNRGLHQRMAMAPAAGTLSNVSKSK